MAEKINFKHKFLKNSKFKQIQSRYQRKSESKMSCIKQNPLKHISAKLFK